VPTLSGTELAVAVIVSRLANDSSMTSLVTSRMPCRYFEYMSSLTTFRLLGMSRIDANRRASSELEVISHYKHIHNDQKINLINILITN